MVDERDLFFQVKTNFRTAITIPEKSWSQFRDVFQDFVDKMKDVEDGGCHDGGGDDSACDDDGGSAVAEDGDVVK